MKPTDETPTPNHFDDYVPLETAPLPEMDMDQLMRGHVWKQDGNYLHCESCVYPHGMVMHGHETLKHQDGGMPHIEKHL